jgi:hypothetical protein
MGWDVVGGLRDAAAWTSDTVNGALDDAGHAIDGAVHGAEHAIDDGRHAIVDFGEQHGGVVGKAIAQQVSDGIGVVEGASLAAYDMGAGAVTLARGVSELASPVEWLAHPEQNMQRLTTAGNSLTALAKLSSPIEWAMHPSENGQAVTALWNGVTKNYQGAAASGDYSKIAGRLVVDVGSMLVGAGEANAAIKAAEGVNVLGHSAEAANVLVRGGDVVAPLATASKPLEVGTLATASEPLKGGALATATEPAKVGALATASEPAKVGATATALEPAKVSAAATASEPAKAGAVASETEVVEPGSGAGPSDAAPPPGAKPPSDAGEPPPMPDGLSYRTDLPQHLAGPDGFKGQSLNGTHNQENAISALEARGITPRLEPTGTKGISELKYDIVKADGTIKTYSKTVYDPAAYSDSTMLDLAQSAGEKAFAAFKENPTGPSTFDCVEGGVHMRAYINNTPDGVPYVGNVHPIK